MLNILKAAMIICSLSLLMTACGQIGHLYLPEKESASTIPSTTAVEPLHDTKSC